MAYSWARRQEIARTQGFSGATEKRNAVRFANDSKDFARLAGGKAGGVKGQNLDKALLYYQAFAKGDPRDYKVRTKNGSPTVVKGKDGTVKGAKAKWLIDVAGYVPDAEAWKARYPRGLREPGIDR